MCNFYPCLLYDLTHSVVHKINVLFECGENNINTTKTIIQSYSRSGVYVLTIE